jgi:hypothetical protein
LPIYTQVDVQRDIKEEKEMVNSGAVTAIKDRACIESHIRFVVDTDGDGAFSEKELGVVDLDQDGIVSGQELGLDPAIEKYYYIERGEMSNPSIKLNLVGVDLAGEDLAGADIRNADLSGADLSYADLSGADLSYTNLTHADLQHAFLRWANLSYANLADGSLAYADLRNANLSYANLNHTNMMEPNLKSANLSYADIGTLYWGLKTDELTNFTGTCLEYPSDRMNCIIFKML